MGHTAVIPVPLASYLHHPDDRLRIAQANKIAAKINDEKISMR